MKRSCLFSLIVSDKVKKFPQPNLRCLTVHRDDVPLTFLTVGLLGKLFLYSETSGGQDSNLYFNAVHFFSTSVN